MVKSYAPGFSMLDRVRFLKAGLEERTNPAAVWNVVGQAVQTSPHVQHSYTFTVEFPIGETRWSAHGTAHDAIIDRDGLPKVCDDIIAELVDRMSKFVAKTFMLSM